MLGEGDSWSFPWCTFSWCIFKRAASSWHLVTRAGSSVGLRLSISETGWIRSQVMGGAGH